MRRVALIFLLAIIIPCIGLAWLALRSLRDQRIVIERQQALLYQNVSDSLQRAINDTIATEQHTFEQQVDTFLSDPQHTLSRFDTYLTQAWPISEVGFIVSPENRILSPRASDARARTQNFLVENGKFLSNQEPATVYNDLSKTNFAQANNYTANNTLNANTLSNTISNSAVANNSGTISYGNTGQSLTSNSAITSNDSTQNTLTLGNNSLFSKLASGTKSKKASLNAFSQQFVVAGKTGRAVVPQKTASETQQLSEAELSKLESTEAEFRQLCRDANEGAFARFLQNKLNVMFWYRSPQDPALIFGAQLQLPQLIDALRETIRNAPGIGNEICVALLDDNAHPVELSRAGFHANWKSPFVASEIGEVLPHWEIAIYLVDPQMLHRSVHALQWTLGGLVAALVLAISAGSCFIVADIRRELRLARQKTDFVSNVSHELKTPLTSIRMFSELLAEGRVSDEAKRRSYLQIISSEASRLTRLINNVLDFARLERGEKKYNLIPCDVACIVRETLESFRPHLEQSEFEVIANLPARPLYTLGEADAIAQIIVNLVSNAEKYASDGKSIQVDMTQETSKLVIRVLDRGPGIPKGYEAKIFEKFFRVNDSLNSGIQGSGLGLTLARQIAHAHYGEISYAPRSNGPGACFTLELPCVPEANSN